MPADTNDDATRATFQRLLGEARDGSSEALGSYASIAWKLFAVAGQP